MIDFSYYAVIPMSLAAVMLTVLAIVYALRPRDAHPDKGPDRSQARRKK